MNYSSIIRPTTDVQGNVILDMRPSNKLGEELCDQIYASVEHTQKFIQTELPNWLIVTQKQFASLNNYTQEMYDTVDRLMRTPHNVMQVKIDREVGTVDSIEAVMQEVDKLEVTDATENS